MMADIMKMIGNIDSEAYSLDPIPPGSCPRIRPLVFRLQTSSQHGFSGPTVDMGTHTHSHRCSARIHT